MSTLRVFLSRWQNLVSLAIIMFFFVVAVAAPWLAPQENPEDPSPYRIHTGEYRTAIGAGPPQPPGEGIPLGTAPRGVDVYYSLVWGTWPALRFGLIVALASAIFGTLVGSISGYVGGRTSDLAMRFTDAFLAFPAIAGVFLFRQVMVPPSADIEPTAFQQLMMDLDFHPVMLALILFSWMSYARVINANVILLKGREYVMAANTLGARRKRRQHNDFACLARRAECPRRGGRMSGLRSHPGGEPGHAFAGNYDPARGVKRSSLDCPRRQDRPAFRNRV